MDKTQIAKDIRGSIKSGQLDTVSDLLEKEPEMLSWMTPFGTWLHIAAAYGHLEIIEYLINAGIDTNAHSQKKVLIAQELVNEWGVEDYVAFELQEKRLTESSNLF